MAVMNGGATHSPPLGAGVTWREVAGWGAFGVASMWLLVCALVSFGPLG